MSQQRLLEELEGLQAELRQLGDEGAGLTRKPSAMKSDIAEQRREVAELEQQQSELQARKDAADAALADGEQRRLEKLQQMLDDASKLEKLAEGEAAREGEQQVQPRESAEELAAIAAAREQELSALYARLKQMQEENDEVTRSLQSLQQKAAREIPVIEEQKHQQMEDIEDAWAIEREHLIKVFQNQMVIQRELFWHLKRGSYIKQKFSDPRNTKGVFDKEQNDFGDTRLRGDEERLVREHIELKKLLENQRHEIQQLTKTQRDIERAWEAGPKLIADESGGKRIATQRDGTPKLDEGSKAWYQQRVQRMKATLSREERVTKELVNESAELKTVKAGMLEQKNECKRKLDAVLRHQSTAMAALQQDQNRDRREALQRAALESRKSKDPVLLLENSGPTGRTKGAVDTGGPPAAGLKSR